MPTTLLLVRHCAHELLDQCLVGRRIDVPLSENGVERSGLLAVRLARLGPTHIKSSPRFRALQTARPLALQIHRPIVIMREFDELDFGDWAGLSFAELDHDSRWKRWNTHRSAAAPPGGETMRELQARVVRAIFFVVRTHPGQSIVIVSHAEPIRAALLHFHQIPLDDFARIKVDPGSLTTLEFHDDRCTVIGENESVHSDEVAA